MEDSAEDAEADNYNYITDHIRIWHNLLFYRRAGYAFLRPIMHMRR